MRLIEITSPFRHGRRLLSAPPMIHCGTYEVPRDFPDEIADEALALGHATELPLAPMPPSLADGRWAGKTVVVAAPGFSLSEAQAALCKGFTVLAVGDAYRLFPEAEVLYHCDAAWWNLHEGASEHFAGERWSSHDCEEHDNKLPAAAAWGLNLIKGKLGVGFSRDPSLIHYGNNSGFQAINLAIIWGAKRIILIGFDMRLTKGGRSHFFGEHPEPLLRTDAKSYGEWVRHFGKSARTVPEGVEILNATPGSALRCFKTVDLDAALSG